MRLTRIDGTGADHWPGSAHEARRFIGDRIPQCSGVEGLSQESDRYGRAEEPPVLVEPKVIEGRVFRSIAVADPGGARGNSAFAAFLDGTQRIEIVSQQNGIPFVWGTVAAAVRLRVDRRLVAWPKVAPRVRRRYYMPFRYVEQLAPELLNDPRVVDTGEANSKGVIPSKHPAALMESAVRKVQQDRELLEREMAEAWCAREDGLLYVDGSITSSPVVSRSMNAVGVIKTHRHLYAGGDAFRVLVGMVRGERTSVFSVAPSSRNPVASWYLRVRSAAGRDALFGLVRVEAADCADMTNRADEISRWILAEGAPLALPDGRWDKMTYGIRDTEEFLRAIS